MEKLKLPFVIILLSAASNLFAQSSTVIKDYIAKYKDIAIEEMIRTGVPASITLAQGIHETSAGQSVLVLKSNNHFGIKCKAEWKGPSVSHDDDARGECFRKYDDPIQSYKDHSDFLKTRAHYASLFNLDPTDYEGWAFGLKKAGYATNPKYPQVLIKLIRDYNLQDYTLIALGKKPEQKEIWASNTNTNKPAEIVQTAVVTEVKKKAAPAYPAGVFKINETNVVFVAEGTSFLAVAQQHNVPLARLFDFNDIPQQETATKDQLIYLQRKRKIGAQEFHTVAEGETLHDIAQAQGIRMESLLAYNFLKENMRPQVGENLHLTRHAPAMPNLATSVAVQNDNNNPAAVSSAPAHVLNNNVDNDYIVHVVQPKETLYSITKKYEVAQGDVMKWNELSGSDLRTGQQLRINKKSVNATN